MTRWVCGALLVLISATAVQVRAEGRCALVGSKWALQVPNPFGGGGAVVRVAPQDVKILRPEPPPPASPRRTRSGVAPAGPVKLDLHGDPLPPGAVARYGTVRLRHGGQPDGLAFSPDGKVLGSVSATHDGIRLWDPPTGKEVGRLNSPVDFAAFARDGSVVVVTGGRCKHWVPASGGLREFPEETIPENTSCVAVNPDLRSFAVGAPKKVVLIDLQTGKPLRELNCPADEQPSRLVYSPDGRWLAGCGDDTGVWLWDLRTNKRVRTYRTEIDGPEFAFSPDGTRLAVTGEHLKVYTTDSEEPLDGFRYTGPEGEFMNPRFSADGKWLFGLMRDGMFVRVNAATGDADEPDAAPAENLQPPVAVAPDASYVAAVDESGGIRIWDPKTGKGPKTERLPGLETPGFSADGKTVSVLAFDGRLHTFDATTGKQLKVLALPSEEGAEVVWDPLARRAATVVGGDDLDVHVIDADTGKVVVKIPTPADRGAPFVAFCPTDRNRIALFTQGRVVVVNAATGKAVRSLTFGKPDESPPSRGAVSPDGRLVAVTTTPLSVWELATGKKRFVFEAVPEAIGTTFSRDGRYLAARQGTSVVVFDLRLGTVARRLEMDRASGTESVAFSPDGKRLAVGNSDGSVAVWDVGTGEVVLTFDGHDGGVSGVGWSADGKRLVSSALDGTALVWDVPEKPADAAVVAAVAGFDEAFRLMGAADPVAAQRGMEYLYRRPAEAVKQCSDRIAVPAAAPAGRIAKLIGELSDEEFAVRQAVVKELEAIGGEAVPHLRAAAAKSESAEARKLAADTILRIEGGPPGADDLRAARAVEVMEGLNTAESRAVLARWAAGPAGHKLTTDAAAALARLPK